MITLYGTAGCEGHESHCHTALSTDNNSRSVYEVAEAADVIDATSYAWDDEEGLFGITVSENPDGMFAITVTGVTEDDEQETVDLCLTPDEVGALHTILAVAISAV